MKNQQMRAAVADANALVRRGLAELLTKDCGFRHVDEIDSGGRLELLLKTQPDIALVVIDDGLPGLNMASMLRELRSRLPNTVFAMLGERPKRAAIFDALSAGAHGFLPKELPMPAFHQALRRILSGEIYVPPMICSIEDAPARLEGAVRIDELTGRQRDVLDELALGKSNKEIARSLQISESTVKVHVAAAFRHLGVNNRVSAASLLRADLRSKPMAEPMLPGLIDRRRSGEGETAAGRLFVSARTERRSAKEVMFARQGARR
jgi:DNA-binding NarL/FixJ family response regulator